MPYEQGGSEIVLTASAAEMSDFKKSPFIAFTGGFPNGFLPSFFLRKYWYPPVESDRNGIAKYAPYGLRKIEASLIENGFDESDVAVVHPNNLDRFVGPKTRAVGISTMDPLGMGFVSSTYSSLIGIGEPINAMEYRKLMQRKCLRKYKPKIIVGGAGSWQLERLELTEAFGVDCVIIGEGEEVAPEIFSKAVKGEDLPRVVYAKSPYYEKIPTIKHASIYGCVEISRGCGRNCQFCTPTMRDRISFPLDKIMKEVEINVKEGSNMILLNTEDALLYGAKEGSFIPNRKAVLNLFKTVSSYPEVKIIQPAHISLTPVVADADLIRDLSEILAYHTLAKHHGKPIMTAEIGLETGSPRIIQKYMAGKTLPFKPKEWNEIVHQAFGILNDNDWYPLATLIVGIPDETEDDVIMTIELIEDLCKYRTFFVPLLFVPLEDCILKNKRGANLSSLSKAQWELISLCWEYNIDFWRSFDKRLHKLFFQFITGLFYLSYYKWKVQGKFLRRLILKIAGIM